MIIPAEVISIVAFLFLGLPCGWLLICFGRGLGRDE